MQEMSSKACRLRPSLLSEQRAQQHADLRYTSDPVFQKQSMGIQRWQHCTHNLSSISFSLFPLDNVAGVLPLLTLHELFTVTCVMTMRAIHAVTDI